MVKFLKLTISMKSMLTYSQLMIVAIAIREIFSVTEEMFLSIAQ